jgi:hypothetical protein
MLKLIGILTGSALAVAFLIVALGVPDFSAPEPEPLNSGSVTELAISAPEVIEIARQTTDLDEDIPPPAEETSSEAVSSVTDPETPETAVTDPETEALIEQIFNPGPEEIIEENWYAFWSPFRSEIAAQGFVSKLQETTGIDYRVVKVKTGVYEVAFAYVDDADIQDKLARISNATGLNMTDS